MAPDERDPGGASSGDGRRARESFASLSTLDRADAIFGQLLDAAPDAVVVVDEKARIVLINRQTETLFAYSREELLGREIEVLIPDRFRPGHASYRNGFIASPKIRPMGSGLELFGRKRDGTEFPVEISLSPLSTDRGMLISASIRDISDRKLSERKIRRIQEQLLGAVESIQGAFAIFDPEDRLVLCNSTYRASYGGNGGAEIVGLTFQELLDARLDALGLVEGSPARAERRAAVLAYHRDPQGAMELRDEEGRHLRVVERRTVEGGTLVTIWDVTDDVHHEAALLRAQAEAEAASSAKSEFLSSMSHELRTPLNAILGFAQLLHRDKKSPLPDRHRERIEHVLKAGEHLLRLIDDVLDLSRIEAGRVSVSTEPVRLHDVLAEVKTTLDPMAARSEATIVVDALPSGLPEVLADRTRFKQILMNYGSNAIKYGRRGGLVTLHAAVEGERARVTVTDDGVGIPADKQDRIFQPFHRAGQETGPIEGTGIGLAISKRLADLMGGAVGFSSREGTGSTFWIEVAVHRPVADPSRDAEARASLERAHQTIPADRRHLVVYIEDNPSNIAFMEDLLADYDRVELITAPTAEIGIELVRARRPDLVIMDINLPGMSGLEATRRLREWPETAPIPIVALSAAAMVRDRQRIADAGFYRYLTKPVKVDELAAVLEELLSPA